MSSKDHNGARSTPLQLQVVEFPLHQLTPNPANPSAVSRFDDLSLLGRHRLICGSALEPTCFSQLRNGELATAIITDSHYNVQDRRSRVASDQTDRAQHQRFWPSYHLQVPPDKMVARTPAVGVADVLKARAT